MNIDFENMQIKEPSKLARELADLSAEITSVTLKWEGVVDNGIEIGAVLHHLPPYVSAITFESFVMRSREMIFFPAANYSYRAPGMFRNKDFRGLLAGLSQHVTTLTVDGLIENPIYPDWLSVQVKNTDLAPWYHHLPNSMTHLRFIADNVVIPSYVFSSLPPTVTTLSWLNIKDIADSIKGINPFIETIYLNQADIVYRLVPEMRKKLGMMFPHVKQVYFHDTRGDIINGTEPVTREVAQLTRSLQLPVTPPSLTNLSARKVAENHPLKMETVRVIDTRSKKPTLEQAYSINNQLIPQELTQKIMFFKPRLIEPTVWEKTKNYFGLPSY